jgi:membrane protease YdiL (CAAX protease family)
VICDKISRYRSFLLIAVAAVMLSLYTYLKPENHAVNVRFSVFNQLAGDLSSYGFRFALSLILFGLIPITTAVILGYKPADIGIRKPFRGRINKYYLLLLPAAVFIGFASAHNADFARFYPYSKTLQSYIVEGNAVFLILHIILYAVLYYIPWEIFFRGILIFPLISSQSSPGAVNPNILAVASFQALPSALIHFGHPFSETLSAVFFGLFLAYLTLRNGSILPGLILHMTVGISMDVFIVLNALS